jgi:hypothetical protein
VTRSRKRARATIPPDPTHRSGSPYWCGRHRLRSSANAPLGLVVADDPGFRRLAPRANLTAVGLAVAGEADSAAAAAAAAVAAVAAVGATQPAPCWPTSSLRDHDGICSRELSALPRHPRGPHVHGSRGRRERGRGTAAQQPSCRRTSSQAPSTTCSRRPRARCSRVDARSPVLAALALVGIHGLVREVERIGSVVAIDGRHADGSGGADPRRAGQAHSARSSARCAATCASAAGSAPSRMTANSSPPRRAARSDASREARPRHGAAVRRRRCAHSGR